jgi:co-chaperonin GroES (HSP10)
MAAMARRKSSKIPGSGYMRQPVAVSALEMVGQWLVVREDFEDPARPSGLLVVTPGTLTTTIGTVVKAGPECELIGIVEGAKILFEQWSGGRWALKDDAGQDMHVLIMSADAILARVEEG